MLANSLSSIKDFPIKRVIKSISGQTICLGRASAHPLNIPDDVRNDCPGPRPLDRSSRSYSIIHRSPLSVPSFHCYSINIAGRSTNRDGILTRYVVITRLAGKTVRSEVDYTGTGYFVRVPNELKAVFADHPRLSDALARAANMVLSAYLNRRALHQRTRTGRP
jgi:hypothetical protein